MQHDAKRLKTVEKKVSELKTYAKEGEAAKAAALTAKRLQSTAQTRIAKPIVTGGDTLTAANKHTALNSDVGGEMAGVLNCMR